MEKMKNRAHFIGIGGIGMSAIARILNRQGFKITGSDKRENSLIGEMRSEGIKCFKGHRAKNLEGSDIVVYSSSIKKDNVELKAAVKKGIRVMHRADMLAGMITKKKSIAVTGTHGKTTATAATALVFEKAALKPTAAIGGEVQNFRSNALCGAGGHFILEADESDGSLVKFRPDKAVLLNVDREHFDHFKNIDNVLNTYMKFAENVKKGGVVYYNSDDANLRRLMLMYHGKRVSFGMSGRPDVKAVKIRQYGMNMHFKCHVKGRAMSEEIVFPAPGRHNVTNALAAIAVSLDEGISLSNIREALACYRGTRRRFDVKSIPGGITLVEDYAHHPAEIKAVLRACKAFRKKLIVVFQPHRYTRTKDLFKEFIDCFRAADRVILTDIYAASEKVIRGVTAKRLSEEMRQSGIKGVEYMKKGAIAGRVKKIAKKSDMVLILGAGDISEVAKELVTSVGDV